MILLSIATIMGSGYLLFHVKHKNNTFIFKPGSGHLERWAFQNVADFDFFTGIAPNITIGVVLL